MHIPVAILELQSTYLLLEFSAQAALSGQNGEHVLENVSRELRVVHLARHDQAGHLPDELVVREHALPTHILVVIDALASH